jgi:hypothetical protein
MVGTAKHTLLAARQSGCKLECGVTGHAAGRRVIPIWTASRGFAGHDMAAWRSVLHLGRCNE